MFIPKPKGFEAAKPFLFPFTSPFYWHCTKIAFAGIIHFMEQNSVQQKSAARLLFEIFLTFCKIGAVTFGGGLAMLPILERELAQKKGWVTSEELIDYYAIGQATPGIIAVNVATFCGHKLVGIAGGIVATVAIVTPSIIVISVLAMFISSIDQIPVIKKALTGINIAVAANLSFSIISLFKKTIVSVLSVFLFVTAFVLIFFFKVNTVLIIFAAIALGIALYFGRRGKGEGAE